MSSAKNSQQKLSQQQQQPQNIDGHCPGRLPLLLLLGLQLSLATGQSAHNALMLLSTEAAIYRHQESRVTMQATMGLNLCWLFAVCLALAGLVREWPGLLLPHIWLSLLLLPYHGLLLILLLFSSAQLLALFISMLILATLLATLLLERRQLLEMSRKSAEMENPGQQPWTAKR